MTDNRFVKGFMESPLLNMLGVPYGILYVKGLALPILVDDHDGAMTWLSELVKQQLITAGEAMTMETAISKAELKSTVATFNKARDFQVAPGFSPSLNFKVCDCAKPFVHGRICYKDNGEVASDDIFTLAEGFNLCEDLGQLGGTNQLDAVKLFQQMLAAGLPADGMEWRKRYDALPAEPRRQAEEAAAKEAAEKILVIIMNRPPREEN